VVVANVDGPVWLPVLPPSLEQYLAPNFQPVPLIPALGIIMATAYLLGAIRIWTGGNKWSISRTMFFLSGCAVLVIVMGAGVEGYGFRMFSVFMFQQLTLMMAIPPLLVLGSPGTLLLRATPHRGAGRLVLLIALWGLRARITRILLHPSVMIPLFLFTFYGVYFTGIADALLSSWFGHVGLELVFLAAGILFTIPLISVDPLPKKQSHPARLLDAFAEMPLHTFFGVFVMMATVPLVKFFSSMPADWNIDPIVDQGIAGGLAWSYGELPSLVIVIVLLFRWERDDTAKATAATKRANLQGDAELDAYNEHLSELHAREARRP
jgi:putative membrane protein